MLESTTLASPPVTLQVVVVTWTNPNSTLTESLWSILVDNAVKWADEGWGGFVAGQSVIYLTPVLNKEQASESMEPVIDFGGKLEQDGVAGAQLLVLEFPSWYTFFNTFASTDSAVRVISPCAQSIFIQGQDRISARTWRSRHVSSLAPILAHHPPEQNCLARC